MSLNAALTLLLEEYPNATEQPFAGNPVAEFIRQTVPEAIEAAIGDNHRYLVRGSAGQGNWARVPWAAVFDRFVTDTAQDGYYLIYLVKEDFTGIYHPSVGETARPVPEDAPGKRQIQYKPNTMIRACGFVFRMRSMPSETPSTPGQSITEEGTLPSGGSYPMCTRASDSRIRARPMLATG